ncbi:MAG: serine/threonine protein kinase [Pirellulales bacterium]|nr:serine/threonine protein kinase [Pirellulales bacterium]
MYFPKWLRQSRDASVHAQAHMTFGQTSVGRTVTRTALLLKKQLWIWPIVALVLLGSIGWVSRLAIHRTMNANLGSELQTLLGVERAMLEKWFKSQEASATTLANDPEVRRLIGELLAASDVAAPEPSESGGEIAPATNVGKLRTRLLKELEPGMAAHDFVGFVVADKRQQILASNAAELVGQQVPQYEEFLSRTFEGRPAVCPPFASVAIVKDSLGRLRTGTPTMFVTAPVRDDNFQVVAVLGLRIRPEKEFTNILQLGRIGQSGETYAVDAQGLMVSRSRFDDALILLGLLPDREESESILNIQVRDPGGDMTQGFRPTVRRHEMPLTHGAEAVVAGGAGVDLAGYRDYRGVPVVGTWTWLPDYQLGLITEIDSAEAFHPLTILDRTFHFLFALLALAAAAIFIFTLVVARLQRQAQRAAIEAKQLGQYRLLDKIGAGAMGIVYKGQHAMLRRPTAIKMLDVERVNEASTARFEREVQITCQLNNPHTVAIYDYGRTPEGVFYYAMEYLDGIDLQKLVEQYGPQSEGRVVSILRQICASLYEAHSLGLVHRDIKPANIMLNRRGAEPDVVKVLDFGLVRAQGDDKQNRESESGLAGTPLYMSPESIQAPDSVDARSDLYAVGAVGYFLLTGQTAFMARTLVELCQQHLTAIPDAPSERLGRPISPELEHAILACLEKSRAKRPQTARDLAAMLERVAARWTLDDAEAWWSRHERGQHVADILSASGVVAATVAAGAEATRDGRTPASAAPSPAAPSSTSPAASPGGQAHGSRTVSTGLDQTAFFDTSSDDE